MAEQRSIRRDLVRGANHDGTVASPPDDGGDQGNFTVPADTMQVEREEERTEPHPPLHTDPTHTGTMDRQLPRGGLGVATGTMFVIALVAMAVVIVLLVAGG